jgi:hypothetical protein
MHHGPVAHDAVSTASYLLDLIDPHTEERYSIYRCDTCFALVASEDAADHGQWHAEVTA